MNDLEAEGENFQTGSFQNVQRVSRLKNTGLQSFQCRQLIQEQDRARAFGAPESGIPLFTCALAVFIPIFVDIFWGDLRFSMHLLYL